MVVTEEDMDVFWAAINSGESYLDAVQDLVDHLTKKETDAQAQDRPAQS